MLLPGVYDDVLSFSEGNAGKVYVPQSCVEMDNTCVRKADLES